MDRHQGMQRNVLGSFIGCNCSSCKNIIKQIEQDNEMSGTKTVDLYKDGPARGPRS